MKLDMNSIHMKATTFSIVVFVMILFPYFTSLGTQNFPLIFIFSISNLL